MLWDYGTCSQQSTVLAHLSKVCRVPHHVNVEQFGHIARPCIIVLLLEGRPDVRTLLVHQVPLVLGRFAGPDCSNKITYTHCHRHLRPTLKEANLWTINTVSYCCCTLRYLPLAPQLQVTPDCLSSWEGTRLHSYVVWLQYWFYWCLLYTDGSLVKIASENLSNDKCNWVYLNVRLLHWQGNSNTSTVL